MEVIKDDFMTSTTADAPPSHNIVYHNTDPTHCVPLGKHKETNVTPEDVVSSVDVCTNRS